MTAIENRTYGKMTCGACSAGMHHLCPVAVWSPGSSKGKDKGRGVALWCPCLVEPPHTDRAHPTGPRCRECGAREPMVELGPDLTCTDRAACALAIEARLSNDPLHQLIVECRTAKMENGEWVERPRRATPRERAAAKAERVARRSRPCTCGCLGTTKGGAFLPGHDARYVSTLVAAVREGGLDRAEAMLRLGDFPALLAKFEKRLAG